MNYARNSGLLSENYDYGRPAITSTSIFDDASRIVYSADVKLLSQAVVITGSTDGGVLRFRAEVAAVVTRMAKAELCKS